jgi:transposase InsO family protein
LDFTSLRILWFRFTLAAILDGFSRRPLCLRIYDKTPRSKDVVRLLRTTAEEFGKPRFLITDHGTQFRSEFHAKLTGMGIHHVRGRVRAPYLNGRIERLFRTFRLWWRFVLTGLSLPSIQRRLDDYGHWYNHYRPQSALEGLTPEEAWKGTNLRPVIAFRACDALSPCIRIGRVPCRGDPRLPILPIQVRLAA